MTTLRLQERVCSPTLATPRDPRPALAPVRSAGVGHPCSQLSPSLYLLAVGVPAPAVSVGCGSHGLPGAVVRASDAGVVTSSIGVIWPLRLYARRSGREVGMSRVTPLTVRAEAAHSDARRAMVAHFAADGEIDEREAAVIAAHDEAGRLLSRVDLMRRVGDWVRDAGELPEVVDISPYLMRQWKELHDEPNEAA